MKPLYKLFTPMALLVVFAVIVSGCSAGQQVTAADIIAKMRETMKTTQTSQSTVDLSLTLNKDGINAIAQTFAGSGMAKGKDFTSKLPDTALATVKTWKQQPDKARLELVSSSLPGGGGATLVYNGEKVYAYSPQNNTVYTGTPDKMEQIPAEVQAMMQSGDIEKNIDTLIASADIKLAGTEQVAGRDAYKLDITPKPGAAANLNLPQIVQAQAGIVLKEMHAVLWVDKDTWSPLKLTLSHPNLGEFSATVTLISLNTPIDASQFVLQTQPGSKVVDLDTIKGQLEPKSVTLPAARDAATADGWKLLEPAYVPGNATLIEIKQITGRTEKASGTGFVMNYSSPETSFSIVQGKTDATAPLGAGFSGQDNKDGAENGVMKDVNLRGTTAKLVSPSEGGWTALTWQEKGSGVFLSVYGKLTADEATKIAEGLK